MEELRLLPLGTSDFAALRLRNQIYVDKSALVYQGCLSKWNIPLCSAPSIRKVPVDLYI